MLLDTGIRSDASLTSLEGALDTIGLTFGDVSEVLVSHLHPDHVGAAAELRRRSGAPVRMPAGEADLVRPLGPEQVFFADTAAFLRRNGMPAAQVKQLRSQATMAVRLYERLVVDGTIAHGQRFPFDGGTLCAIPAPGHSPDLLCFYCPEQRLLFSTDAILPKVTPNIGVHPFYLDNPLRDYLATLDSLERLDVDRVVPSHGRPFTGHQEWIRNTRHHHSRRCDSIARVMTDRPMTAFDIAGQVWSQDLGLVDRRLAMSESLAHLKYMELDERVAGTIEAGLACWHLP